MAILPIKKLNIARASKVSFWFLLGAILGFFFFTSFLYFTYRTSYSNRIYEGVFVDGIDFGGKNKDEARIYFAKKNAHFKNTFITLTSTDTIATISASQIGYE